MLPSLQGKCTFKFLCVELAPYPYTIEVCVGIMLELP